MTDTQAPPTLFSRGPQQHLPPGTAIFAMWLFLMALVMLFAGSILAFLYYRFFLLDTSQVRGEDLGLPWGLWVSTAVILLSSYTIHRALQNVRAERQTAFRNAMSLTLMLGVAFLVVQAPSLATLIQEHWVLIERNITLFGLVFMLILLHALHVIGGVIPLVVVTIKAHAGRYDHEHHNPVKLVAMYWHFLDIVWIVMFIVLLLTS